MSSRNQYNPKRTLRSPRPDREMRKHWLETVQYTGSPYHKRNPGDFGLTPPAAPRPDKTLCDGADIFEREVAQRLLEKGIERGLVSEQIRNEFPQNIWSVTESGVPLEAQLENRELGTYHGYPLLPYDPLHDEVLKWWEGE